MQTVEEKAFYSCKKFKIKYCLTQEDWESIQIKPNNGVLAASERVDIMYTKTAVSDDGKTFSIEIVNNPENKTVAVLLTLYNGNTAVKKYLTHSGTGAVFTADKAYTSAKVILLENIGTVKPVGYAEIIKIIK